MASKHSRKPRPIRYQQLHHLVLYPSQRGEVRPQSRVLRTPRGHFNTRAPIYSYPQSQSNNIRHGYLRCDRSPLSLPCVAAEASIHGQRWLVEYDMDLDSTIR